MTLKILFVPVSSPKGIGEYMRSICLAKELQLQHPDADIRFILNQQTAYHAQCPFPVKLTPRSPTLHTDLVNEYISEFHPDLVLFDASGRVGQLRHCKTLGIKTIFICPRSKKLSKGLAIRRLKYTDRIWLVQPQFALKPLSLWAKIKLQLLRKASPLAIGPIFAKPDLELADKLHQKYGVQPQQYIMVSSGSGGHYVNGAQVSEVFADAAIKIAEQCDLKVFVVHGLNANIPHRDNGKVIEVQHLEAAEFNSLLQQAHAALLAGGSSLLQSLAYRLKVVAAPITEEQRARVSLCASLNLLAQSDMSANTMSEKMITLVNSENTFSSQTVENGLTSAIEDIEALLHERPIT